MVPLNDALSYETVIRRCSARLRVSVVVTVISIRIPYSALRVRCLPLLVLRSCPFLFHLAVIIASPLSVAVTTTRSEAAFLLVVFLVHRSYGARRSGI